MDKMEKEQLLKSILSSAKENLKNDESLMQVTFVLSYDKTGGFEMNLVVCAVPSQEEYKLAVKTVILQHQAIAYIHLAEGWMLQVGKDEKDEALEIAQRREIHSDPRRVEVVTLGYVSYTEKVLRAYELKRDAQGKYEDLVLLHDTAAEADAQIGGDMMSLLPEQTKWNIVH